MKVFIEAIILGEPQSGKTLILYEITGGDFIKEDKAVESNQFICKSIKLSSEFELSIWDCCGPRTFHSYHKNVLRSKALSLIIYVIDTSDLNSIQVSKRNLWNLLDNPEYNQVFFLIYGSKCDVKNSLNTTGLRDYVEWKKLLKKRSNVHLQICSVIEQCGVKEGFEKFVEYFLDEDERTPKTGFVIYETEISKKS